MSWFSDRCSSIGNFISDVASSVGRAVSSVWDGAKKVAAEAVGWMADKAEGFVGKFMDVWAKVKPLIRPALKIAADWAPWPWVKAVTRGLEKALNWVDKFETSAFAAKLKAAIDWVIQAAKNYREKKYSEAEQKAAQEREEVFKTAEAKMPPEESKAVMLAGLINKFILLQSLIQKTFDENSINDFEHFLRLRATQKLLALSEKVLTESQSIESIGDDEIFLVSIGADLLSATANISESDLNRLNSLIYKRFKKELIPFIFEEMIITWAKNLVDLEREWELGNKTLAKDAVKLRNLENLQKLGGKLEPADMSLLLELRESVPKLKAIQDALAKSNREMRNYVYAAEGFLEILESNAALDGKEYLVEQVNTVGMIIIDCAQNGKLWEELSEDEQDLVIDFANIFKNASAERKSWQEVEVMA